MTSLNEQVNQLHQSYLDATGYELALNGVDERRWFDALKFGVSPDDVKLVVKARIRGITTGDRKPASIYLRNLIGGGTVKDVERVMAGVATNENALAEWLKDRKPITQPTRGLKMRNETAKTTN